MEKAALRQAEERVSDGTALRSPSPARPRDDAAATGSRSRSTGARCARRRASGWSTRPSAATSRCPTSVTSPSSARRSARAACAWSRSRGCPKLQTSCSTPVKDGMVVYTQTDRVKHAQNAVVEFLLVNHPLDCPVCDKGGECPLQDISYGWGPGRSRFVEDKRNFPKPIALSPLIAIDRERCILCYRCVRFSQEVAEDDQLVFLERGDHTFVGHLRRPPLRGAVLGQHHRAVPGRRADQHLVPLPRAAVGHRGRAARSARCARASATSSLPSATSASSACSRATTRRSTTAGCATRAAGATSRRAPERPRARAARARRRPPAPGDLGARARGRGRGARARPARHAPRLRRRADHQRGGLAAPAHLPRGARLAATWTRARAARSRPASRAGCPIPTSPRRWPTSTARRPCSCSRPTRCDEAPIFDLRLRKAVRRVRRAAGGRVERADRARRRRRGGAALRARRAPRRCCARSRRRCSRPSGPPTAQRPSATATTAPRPAGHAGLAEFLGRALARAPRGDGRGRRSPTCATSPRC